MTFNLKEWRSRLNITQEKAAELLGVNCVAYTNWESGSTVSKTTKLAALFCELAYIAADNYIEDHPVDLNNQTATKILYAQGKKKIIEGLINEEENVMDNPLKIILPSKEFIQRNK
ncbi:MAG: helix-turn-helix transcriptional regulator [Chitinophagia bacterium]